MTILWTLVTNIRGVKGTYVDLVVLNRDVTIPIPPTPIPFDIGGIGIGIGISITLKKCYLEKLLIFHKV